MTQGHKINTVTQKNDRGKICSSFKKFQSECLKRDKKRWSKVVIVHATDQVPTGEAKKKPVKLNCF